jgi:hypothetical protein
MAGKPLTTVDRWTGLALDCISKNAALEMLVDMVRGEIGIDATDEQVLARLQSTLETVARNRGDKPVNLVSRRQHYYRAAQRWAAANIQGFSGIPIEQVQS